MKEKRQNGCAMFFIVWGLAALAFGLFFNAINVTDQGMGEIVLISLLLGMIIAFAFFCFMMIALTSKMKSESKREKQQLVTSGVVNMTTGKHMAGLPLAEGTFCNILEYADRIVLKANGSDFTLVKGKVTDISIKTDAEITSQYVSSAGGAVAGAVLFGPLGAMVGGRVKKKKNREVYRYLIFTYTKEASVDYISFDVTGTYMQAAKICMSFSAGTNFAKVSVDL